VIIRRRWRANTGQRPGHVTFPKYLLALGLSLTVLDDIFFVHNVLALHRVFCRSNLLGYSFRQLQLRVDGPGKSQDMTHDVSVGLPVQGRLVGKYLADQRKAFLRGVLTRRSASDNTVLPVVRTKFLKQLERRNLDDLQSGVCIVVGVTPVDKLCAYLTFVVSELLVHAAAC